MNSGLSYLITTVSDFLILRKFIMSHDLLNESLDLVHVQDKSWKKQELTVSRGNKKQTKQELYFQFIACEKNYQFYVCLMTIILVVGTGVLS